MNLKQEELRKLSSDFRKGILKCDVNKLPLPLRSFPKGSCGDASLQLGKYLQQNGYADIRYISGWRDTMSHAWLLVDGFIVDITADQFQEISESVIITEDQSWHRQFVEEINQVADFEIYNDESTKSQMWSVYNYILTKIN